MISSLKRCLELTPGTPKMISFSFTSLIGPDLPNIVSPFPIFILLGIPTCPHRVTLSPMKLHPAIPACATMRQFFQLQYHVQCVQDYQFWFRLQ